MKENKTSVVLTTWNGTTYLPMLLDSIRSQTMMPDEIVVVDDASSDDTWQLLQRYQHEHPDMNFQLFRNEKNLGWKRNFMKAASLASGEILFFADQDDIWEPDKIRAMNECFQQNTDMEVLGCDDRMIDESGSFNGKRRVLYPGKDGHLERISVSPIFYEAMRPGCGTAIRKSLLDVMEKYWQPRCAHDELAWSLGVLRDTAWLLHRDLLQYRIHRNNTTRKDNSKAERIEMLEMQLENVRQCQKYLAESQRKEDNGEKFAQRAETFFRLRIAALKDGKRGDLLKVLRYLDGYTYLPAYLKDWKYALK